MKKKKQLKFPKEIAEKSSDNVHPQQATDKHMEAECARGRVNYN